MLSQVRAGHDITPIEDKELQMYEFHYQGLNNGGHFYQVAKKVDDQNFRKKGIANYYMVKILLLWYG
jgi:hypothetical protein